MPTSEDEYIKRLRKEEVLRKLRALSKQLDDLEIKHLFQVDGVGKD